MGPALIIALVVSWLVSWRLLLRLRNRKDRGGKFAPQSVSVIIPARNEAHNLPHLLGSILRGVRPAEILVVDDGSTDGTAGIAASMGAKVIQAGPRPPGWHGKTWPCQCGAMAAEGEILMFVDADCWFEKDGFGELLQRYPGGAFSVLPWHRPVHFEESFSVMFNILMAVGTIPSGLSGPCLLVGRTEHRQVGGHEAVKSEVLEAFHLADHFHRACVPVGSICGKGMIGFRMYPDGLRSLVPGWMKGFSGGAARTPPSVMALVSIWMSGLIVSAVVCWVHPLGWLAWAAFAGQFAVLSWKVGRFHWLASIAYPVMVVFYLAVFFASLCGLGKQVKWKGRAVHGA